MATVIAGFARIIPTFLAVLGRVRRDVGTVLHYFSSMT